MNGPVQLIADFPTGRLEFCDVGSGIPVLYFHGTGAGNDAAVLLERQLIASGCRLIVPNRPGYGSTSPGVRGSADYCARLAVELLDRLQLGSVAVIGTSSGGMPAAAFAHAYPARTAALVLQCAQSHRWDETLWLPAGCQSALLLFRHRVCYPLLRWYNRRHARTAQRHPLALLRSMSGSAASLLASDNEVMGVVKALANMTAACAAHPQGIENDWSMLVGDNSVRAGSIHSPTLIIHDYEDPLVPVVHAEWSRSSIPHAELLEMRGSGHLIWYGSDAQRMHQKRMEFLRAHAATNDS